MEKFVITGTEEGLHGRVKISGAKNAVLPILAACLLTEEVCEIQNVPPLADVRHMAELLTELGARVEYDAAAEKMCVQATELTHVEGVYETARKMRASFLAAGALLARCGAARLPLPGGCQIGSRPIDLHLKGFHLMGAKSRQAHGMVELQAKALRGSDIYLDFPSVGATENILLAATRAKGITTIENAAAEPEICDLADFLRKMGAEIEGDGTDTITIRGGKELHGAVHRVIPDRMEAGTFLAAAAITGGDIILENVRVHKDNLLGQEGKGFINAMKTLDTGRMGVAAQSIGVAQGCLDEAIKYAKERKQFGRPIAKFQAIAFMLAEMATKLEAAKNLVYKTAWLIDNGQDASMAASMAKFYASEVCNEIAAKTVQIHGGYGFIKDYKIERMFRDCRVFTIYEGTSQVQQMVISGKLLK